MDFQKNTYDEEIVLTYRPAQQVKPVELRYECELPERLKAAGPVPAEPLPADKGAPLSKQKKRSALKVVASIILCVSIALGSVGFGLWCIVDSVVRTIPSENNQNAQQDDQIPDNGNEKDNDTEKGSGGNDSIAPDRDYDNSHPDNTGDPNISVFRPGDDAPRLQLVSAARNKRALTATQIYQKVAPATVTVLGTYGSSYSVGTGIIFTSDGYIVTNFHVIAGCYNCEVWITNEYGVDDLFTAEFVGGDEEKDIAVLKIDAANLPVAEFGVSSELSVGDVVYAIGNPLGTELRSTFTDGIVSAVDRNVEVDGITLTMVQTNAALNSGNSGGPLINEYGQVIGINTIKMMSGEDTIEGLGFAIPSSIAANWINDIIDLGYVRPSPVLGLSVNRIPVKLDDGTEGLEVLEVTMGLGAHRAGVKVGDVIVGFNGVTVTRVDHIYAERLKLNVGDQVTIRVYRDGRYLDLVMTMMAQSK